MLKKISSIFLLLAAFPGGLSAEVKLNGLFGSGMVLQRERPVPIWGEATPGESVTVEFAGQKKTGMADPNGKWLVRLDPLTASADSRALRVTGKDSTVQLEDLLVGEVWLCSGQSNMEWALWKCIGGPEAVASAPNPGLRLCTIPHNSQFTPQESVSAKWVASGAAGNKNFSAVAWWFGSKLQKELQVPVGIINDSYGGTRIESWMSEKALKNGPWPQDKTTVRDLAKAQYDELKAKMQPAMDKFLADKAKAILDKQPEPTQPAGWPGDFRGPTVLWNGMVSPLLNFSIRGVLWYQGESNAYVGVADTYKALLPVLIREWRAGFGQPELPFIIYQISPNRKPQTDPNEYSGIAVLQEAQLKTAQTTPHTALVVTMDLGETNVHYLNKEPAGERGMKAALGIAYGKSLEYSSPMQDSFHIEGTQAVIHFAHAGGGLVAKDGPLSGFVVAGEDHQFRFADARIDGDKVVVSSPQVPKPVAVRNGWADFPKVNLFSKEGLPAAPFRTDDWGKPEK